MFFWTKTDEKEVYIHINGEVCAEHIDFLHNNLMARLQYGYRRIVLDVNNVKRFDNTGITMLKTIRDRILKRGGELIIEDKNGIVDELV